MIDFFTTDLSNKILDHNGISINLIRSKRRKTLSLEVNHQGVKVRAPLKMSELSIMKFICSKEQWILKNLQTMSPPPEPMLFEDGNEILLLGKSYKIKLTTGRKPIFINELDNIVIPFTKSTLPIQTSIKNKVIQWYKKEAMQQLEISVNNSMRIMLPQYRSPNIKVRDYKRRWGSCNHRGDLSFNWRIIMAPSNVVDYVVTHEIAHLKEFNHSPKFWNIVEQQMPDWKDQQQWLKINGAGLYRF